MSTLQKTGGIAAISEAIIYIAAFIFFGMIWDFPVDMTIMQKFAFLKENQTTLTIVNLFMYIIFGIGLALLVPAIYQRLKNDTPVLAQIASIFGIVWIVLIIASGMIANIGLDAVLNLSIKNPEQAMTIWLTINAIVEALGGGNEIVGGLWVLLLSIAAFKGHSLPKTLSYLGIFVGTVGVLTVYPADVLTEIFGLSQIIWFIWLGAYMLRSPQ